MLSNMRGTEKQIAWATDIVNDAINTMEINLARYKKYDLGREARIMEKLIEGYKTSLVLYNGDAGKIIENRSRLNANACLRQFDRIYNCTNECK